METAVLIHIAVVYYYRGFYFLFGSVSFMSKSLTVDNQTIKFQIWDTAGQERVSPLSLFLSLSCIHIHIYADTLLSSMSSRAVICVCVSNVKPFYLSLSTVSLPVTSVLQKCGSCYYSV